MSLPLEGQTQTDLAIKQQLNQKYNVDPYDVEAMLAISYPKP